MKYLTTAGLIFISFLFGIILYGYQKEWIIFIPPYATAIHESESKDQKLQHKTVSIFFFKHNQWHAEEINSIWSCDAAQNVKTITNNWLTLLEDEKIIDKDIQVVSSIISPSKELFLSFNKDPFIKQDSTYTKFMVIEGLLKTIRTNKIPVQSVRFLIHHQQLIDDHINFSISWPLTGYLKNV